MSTFQQFAQVLQGAAHKLGGFEIAVKFLMLKILDKNVL